MATGVFGTPTVKQFTALGNMKLAVISVLGSSSYATGGDTLDLSNAAGGLANLFSGFAEVYSVKQCAVDVAASSKYHAAYIPATAGAAATGKIKFNDLTAASDAEISNATDLSGVTFYFEVTGR